LRTEQRDELAQLRRDAAEERASLRAEATQQLRAVLAQLDPRRASAGAGADPGGGDDTAEHGPVLRMGPWGTDRGRCHARTRETENGKEN
jgi:hypothetical protein